MNNKNRPWGYTVIEVLIVLTISGAMFVAVAGLIDGRQARAAFSQGVNELASRIQNTAEQVVNGQYSDIPVSCTFSGGSTNPNGAGGSAQGTNTQCVFLGKLLHFSVGGVRERYEVFSLAGGRVTAENLPIVELVAADPTAVRSLTTVEETPENLTVRRVTAASDAGGAAVPSYMFGFFQGQGTTDEGGTLQNGAQAAFLYYVNGATDSMNEGTAENQIQGNLVRATHATICLTDNQSYAVLTVGGSTDETASGQLKVGVRMYGTTVPAAC